MDPQWGWLAQADKRRKTQAYHDFCMQETFYRPYYEVRGCFNNVGFEVTSVSADHPVLRRLRAIPKPLIEFPVRLFQTVEIMVRKQAAARLSA
jgi:hypothetical protein